jgi:hypothetical protein
MCAAFRNVSLTVCTLSMQPISRAEQLSRPTETRLHLLREHRLHGIITGLEKVQTMASADDGLDRLIVSFKDAKVLSRSVHFKRIHILIRCLEDCPHGMVGCGPRSYNSVNPHIRTSTAIGTQSCLRKTYKCTHRSPGIIRSFYISLIPASGSSLTMCRPCTSPGFGGHPSFLPVTGRTRQY